MSWREVVLAYDHLILLYFLVINTHYLVLMLIGFQQTCRALREMEWRDLRHLMQSPLTPPISVIAPAYNGQWARGACQHSSR